ncbi:hypothetical protein [uncultured Tateyamaria sp.]|uniref:hypothetical protein n=1 Tax=uncultured Tateyamaria sp. TaxID=455651 RepID=UPI002622CF63|nr:hypothetical protein [uncultured Tateyamaria sp.]
MDLISDILLMAGALGAGFYCFILGRRLKRFNDLEKGVGGAVAVLSAQVDDLSKMLAAAQDVATESANTLTQVAENAEQTSRRLELQIASLHDIPEKPQRTAQPVRSADSVQQPDQPMFVRRTAGNAK